MSGTKQNGIDMMPVRIGIDVGSTTVKIAVLDDNDKLIYGKWFNYSNNADKEHLEMMLFQKEIPILLIDSKTNEQFTFYVTNDFSSGIKEHIKKTNSIKMSDFDFNSYITYLERNIKSLSKLWYSINA